MLSDVVEYVDERVSHLPRRPQSAGVKPVRPDVPVPPEHTVDALRNADRQALDPTREARRLVRLYHQVQMILLNTEMKNAEAVS